MPPPGFSSRLFSSYTGWRRKHAILKRLIRPSVPRQAGSNNTKGAQHTEETIFVCFSVCPFSLNRLFLRLNRKLMARIRPKGGGDDKTICLYLGDSMLCISSNKKKKCCTRVYICSEPAIFFPSRNCTGHAKRTDKKTQGEKLALLTKRDIFRTRLRMPAEKSLECSRWLCCPQTMSTMASKRETKNSSRTECTT